MVHLRIVAPAHQAEHAFDLLKASDSVTNIVYLARVAHKPEGDVILCDVAREDASVIVSDLKELDIDVDGSIAMEEVDSQISQVAVEAEKAAKGLPSDAVVWEEVEARTSENVELSGSFLAFMALAMLIAACGIVLDQVILIIGAMIVGPEFGPLAGLCVAAVQKRRDLARRSLLALAIGFPVGITIAFLFTLGLDGVGLIPADFTSENHPFTEFIADPDVFSVLVAAFAGITGVLSLTAAKSGALIGVLVSVTTIPAAANIGVASALGDGKAWLGAMGQLSLNLTTIVLAGILTLFIQRRLYVRRRRRHLHEEEVRDAAGLPIGQSRRARGVTR